MKRAFSILEVIVALALFGLITLGLAETFAQYSRMADQSQNQMVATSYAQSLMEEQIGLGFGAQSRPAEVVQMRRGVDQNVSTLELKTTIQVNDLSNSSTPTFKEIQVLVEWQERGKPRQVKLESYVSWQG